MKNKTMKEDEIIADLIRIVDEVDNDPEVAIKEEAFYRKYGTLSGEDLALTFTI
jgi:hypothetical protein